ncbi:MAG: Rect-like protein [Varibaculum cambriense DORA_20]|uniref:Rect-like protein n=1 Tax=Varibaculum cambriense TaxID=184870 RepID=UPI0003D5E6F2|nr:Rect-like protein [Varibaculum cambriense]ETI82573.1 MAG: Rect-like protein [Varibaculum cambriense DORA_20]
MSSQALSVYSQPLDQQINYAKAMAVSNLLPVAYQNHPENVLVALEQGRALGIAPIQAMNQINVIKGKPALSADLIAALVRRAGHRLRVEGDDTYAQATVIRADDPDYIPKPVRWDMERAKRAGLLGNPSWQKYPAAMLRARAISEAARAWANDALYGFIYTPEELDNNWLPDSDPDTGEPVHNSPAPVPVQSQVPQPHPTAPKPDLLNQAQVDGIQAGMSELGLTAVKAAEGIRYYTKGRTSKLYEMTVEEGKALARHINERLQQAQEEPPVDEPPPLDVEVVEQ